jgi:dodecin
VPSRQQLFLAHKAKVFTVMKTVQKVIEIVGISKKSFDDAAKNAVDVAAKSVRNIQWARASEFECKCADGKIIDYRALMRIYFDVE